MRYLIDGYNLLHALGRLTAKGGKHALDSARKGLLVQLVTWHGPDAYSRDLARQRRPDPHPRAETVAHGSTAHPRRLGH